MNSLVFREYNGIQIPQRPDGYINATKMCQAVPGKQWSNFWQLKSTQAYVDALSSCLGIPRQDLVISGQGGWGNDTWVHPRLASRLAQWISPEFAVVVDGWVIDIVEGRHPMPNEVSHEGAIAKGIGALLEATTNMSMQLTQVGLGVAANGHAIGQLTNIVEDHGDRLDKLERKGRKPYSDSTKLLYRTIVWKYYDGCCPIYRRIKLLEMSTKTDLPIMIVNKRNRSIGEYDHFWSHSHNAPEAGWLISEKANREFDVTKKLQRVDYIAAFQEFQRHLSDYLAETKGQQLKLL